MRDDYDEIVTGRSSPAKLQYDADTGKLNVMNESTEQHLLYHVNRKLDEIVKIFSELRDRVDEVETRLEVVAGDTQEYYNKIEDLESTVQDFDLDEISTSLENTTTDLEELKEALRNV